MITSFLGAAYACKNASLLNLINQSRDVTIFAPNNAAMESVSDALTTMSPDDLETLLAYHIVVNDDKSNSNNNKKGPHYSTTLKNSTTLPTLRTGALSLSFASNSFFVNSARILTTDLLIAPGVIHVIDAVLNPNKPAASPDPSLATQSPVLPAASTTDSDLPFTTYVPNVTVLEAGGETGKPGPPVQSYAGGAGASRSRSASAGRATQSAAAKGGAGAGGRESCGRLLGGVVGVVGMGFVGGWLVGV